MKLIFLSILFLFSMAVSAQPHFAFSPIESSNGLSDNKVRNIIQLPDGRMMMMTTAIVNLYNGHSFHYIHLNAEKVYPLNGYHGFHRSYVDGDGHLWIKNKGELMLIDLRKERYDDHPENIFRSYGLNEKLADFFIDAEQNTWMLTLSNKLFYRDKKSSRAITFLTQVTKSGTEADLLYDVSVFHHHLYLFYRSGLTTCYDINTRKEIYSSNSLAGHRQNRYDQTLLVVQNKESLFQIRNGTGGIMLSYDAVKRKWTKVLETDYWLNCLSADQQGNVWLSCKFGLWYFDAGLKTKQFIPTLKLVDGTSIDTEVSTLAVDRQGGLWIGTLDRGLFYYHADRFKFRNIGKTLFPKNVQNDLVVTCFSEGTGGETLVGTRKGLFRHTVNPEKLIPFSGVLAGVQCKAMQKDRQNRIWLSTSSGLYRLSGKQTKHFPLGNINSLFEAADGSLILCTEGNGLGYFNPDEGRYKRIVQGTFARQVTSVSQLVPYGRHSLMGISDRGLFTFNLQTKTLLLAAEKENTPSGMFKHSNHHYNCLLTDSRGLVWFGTQDGLNVWNPFEQVLKHFYAGDGLLNNSIKSIIESTDHSIWVSTSRGIAQITIDKKAKKFRYILSGYNHYDGVIENEFHERSAFINSRGKLFFGGIDGYNQVDLHRISVSGEILDPVISGFQLFGSELKAGEAYHGDTILQTSINTTKEIRLNHHQNFFSFSFTALNYINPTQTFYRYMLEGLDPSWRETSSPCSLGEATYTNIPPGKYVFKVYAADHSKKWNGKPAIVHLLIKPPVWDTLWARLFYALVICGLAYLFISYLTRRSKAKFQRQQKEKMEQLKVQFFTNMSHELRTPLTLILTPLDTILKRLDEGKLKGQLSGIYRNALVLLQQVNQMLDFKRIELNEEVLDLNYCDISEYLTMLCSPFAELALSKNICFTWNSPEERIYVWADKDKLGKIVNNLLSNAFKFTMQGGTVTLEAAKGLMPQSQEEALFIRVSDSGCGIDAEDLPYIFNRYFRSARPAHENMGNGIGLHLVKQYVELHHWMITVKSRPGESSLFTVYIPINVAAEPEKETSDLLPIKQAGTSSLKILIVDDNEEFRVFLSNHLKELYQVNTAANGKEGLEKALAEMPDMVISDIMMPEMDGTELCSRLKNEVRTSHIPVLLLTARSTDTGQLKGYKAGADAYLSKPFNLDILLLQIHNLLEQQEKRKALFKSAIIIQPEALTSTNTDEKLIRKALRLVEENIADTDYSVEQLSRDMNMDRTGLYRKLLALTGQSPTVFIRSIRLKKAAFLLQQMELTVAEISDRVGFSNPAYLSKCFQEEFGVKPSQYAKTRH